MKSCKEKFDRLIDNPIRALLSLIVIFVVYRTFLLLLDSFPFNADEAIVALMGRHILQGQKPLFFYGQAYMGSLDAYLVAFFFKFLGEKVLAIRVLQSTLFFLSMICIYGFVIIAFQNRKMAFVSALMLVFAPVNLIVYTTISLGGYGEALLIGCLSFLVATIFHKNLIQNEPSFNVLFLYIALLGFLAGLGLWTNALSLTFCVPAIAFVVFHLIRRKISWNAKITMVSLTFLGFVVGALPWWGSLLMSGNLRLLTELTGSAVAVSQNSLFVQIGQHLLSFLLFAPTVVLGFRPPWSVQAILPLFIPILAFFWILVFFTLWKGRKNFGKWERQYLLLVISPPLLVMGAYIFTSFGNDPSGRYFLPFHITLSILAAFSLAKVSEKRLLTTILILVLVIQTAGVIRLSKTAPFLTTQFYDPAKVDQREMDQLRDFLLANNERTGYSNYWVSYPLAFISGEQIISVPALPYHPDLRYTARDNRIPAYNEVVESSDSAFYVITNNQPLQELLEEKFHSFEIGFLYEEIGDFHIYYSLNQKISPSQLGLYEYFN